MADQAFRTIHRHCWLVWLGMAAVSSMDAAPLRLVVLGDSLSAEYDAITGVTGVDDPTEYAAISVPGWESMSWVEVLGRLRPDEVDLGGYGTDLLEWGVFRFSGYEYNFAIPGFEASQFEQIVNSSLLSDVQYYPYKQQLQAVLDGSVDAAVVWLGANEFRANYGFLYDGNNPAPLINNLSNDLAEVLDFVLTEHPGIRLVAVNLPDLGASPDKQAAHPDPIKRAHVTLATVLANQAITNLALARGIPVADVFSDTAPLVAGETVWLGPVDLYPAAHPDNHPRHQFTRDGLHPNTCLQAAIAARILETFNQAYALSLPPLTEGEILNLVGIDPLQPYLDWVVAHSLTNPDPGADDDGDGLVNLAEFLFDLDPASRSRSPLALEVTTTTLRAVYQAHPGRERLVRVVPEWSGDLVHWTAVPQTQVSVDPGGAVTLSLPGGDAARFVRLELSVRPLN